MPDPADGGEVSRPGPIEAMDIMVEPVDGTELERLVTVLLNLTGLVGLVIDRSALEGGTEVDVIGRVADRVHSSLAVVAEHHDDEDLRLVVQILLEGAVLTGEDLGRPWP